MQKRPSGKSGLEVLAIGLGGVGLSFGYGPVATGEMLISMHSIKNRLLSFTCLFLSFISVNAQTLINNDQSLSKRERALVLICAFAAKGDANKLQEAIVAGLNEGLTINEQKEFFVQLYAYAGFPRSLNALQSLMKIHKTRKANGIIDSLGKEPNPFPSNISKLDFGTENRTKLVGRVVTGELYDYVPVIDQFLREHLFGDIFGRDNLDWKTRELATIAILASLSKVEDQLRTHFNVGLYNGLSKTQLKELVELIRLKVGAQEGETSHTVLQSILDPTNTKAETNAAVEESLLFPKGEKITNNNFQGSAWLQQMVVPNKNNQVQVGQVIFEPGARSNWHIHPAGQILLVIDGVGYYQEQGSSKIILKKGDFILCPPNTPHWHGASSDQRFVQIAITDNHKGPVIWLKPVSEEDYKK